jgi:hypothetical protein
MNSGWRRAISLTAIVTCAALTATTSMPSDAQIRPAAGNRAGQAVRRPAPRNYLPELKTIADAASKQYEAKIVVDPAIFIATQPTAPDKNLTIDKAMDSFAAAARGLAWRRVYLSQAQGMTLPPAEKLAESVRALDKVEQAGIVLENPLTRKATTYMKDWSVGPNFHDELSTGQFSSNPIYVLYSVRTAGIKPPMEEIADLQRRSMELMMSMDPDQMAQAMDNGVQMFMNMDPELRGRFLGMQMQAGMKMFQNMAPDQRNQLMQSVMQGIQQNGGLPFGGPGGQPGSIPSGGGRRP